MRKVFADTSYFVALLSRKDETHALALAVAQTLKQTRMVSSEMVLVEVLNFFCESGPHARTKAEEMARALRGATQVELLPQTSNLFWKAATHYSSRPDKNWSLTDCSTMLLMEELGIREILTTDHHFEQAGFTVLLKKDS